MMRIITIRYLYIMIIIRIYLYIRVYYLCYNIYKYLYIIYICYIRLSPINGRRVFAEYLQGTWDWKAFFDPFELSMSGIAASHWKPDVCFSKRFLQYRDLPNVNLPGWELEVPKVFENLPRHPQDVDSLIVEKAVL